MTHFDNSEANSILHEAIQYKECLDRTLQNLRRVLEDATDEELIEWLRSLTTSTQKTK